MTIELLAEDFGSLDLLTAYIMRTASVSKERAEEFVVDIDAEFERYLEDRFWEEDA